VGDAYLDNMSIEVLRMTPGDANLDGEVNFSDFLALSNHFGDSVILCGMSDDVTQILYRLEQGDPTASDQLLPLVYEELRKLAAAKMANEKPGQTLQATALVHEAFVRLVDVKVRQDWGSRGHFFSAAAEAMRRILINQARDKGRIKRGGQLQRIDLDQIEVALDTPGENLLAVDEALQRLAGENPQCAELVKLRFFTGLTIEEAATALGVSPRTAKRHWTYARAWLFDALRDDDASSEQ
jgi:RNA polymerase sigma factor (TIGR02999 family)